jgi:hypothetical protein
MAPITGPPLSYLSEPLQEELEATTLALRQRKEYVCARAEQKAATHQTKIAQHDYILALERVIKSRLLPTKGSLSNIKHKGKGKARGTEEDNESITMEVDDDNS